MSNFPDPDFDSKDCSKKKECQSVFDNKDCQCFVQDLEGYSMVCEDGTLNCPIEEQTVPVKNINQFCAYEGEDGVLYGCNARCCGSGCPGQCKDVKPRPPEGIPIAVSSSTSYQLNFHKLVEIVILIIGALLIFNVLILLIRPFLKNKNNIPKPNTKIFHFGLNKNTLNALTKIKLT
jgi:hypothetical protein